MLWNVKNCVVASLVCLGYNGTIVHSNTYWALISRLLLYWCTTFTKTKCEYFENMNIYCIMYPEFAQSVMRRSKYTCMGVQTAALTFALYLYPFHAVVKRETTGRIVSRALSSIYTLPEHNAERYRYRAGYTVLDSVFYMIAISIYMIKYYLMWVVWGVCICALEHHYEIKQLLATCLFVCDKNWVTWCDLHVAKL